MCRGRGWATVRRLHSSPWAGRAVRKKKTDNRTRTTQRHIASYKHDVLGPEIWSQGGI